MKNRTQCDHAKSTAIGKCLLYTGFQKNVYAGGADLIFNLGIYYAKLISMSIVSI